MGMNFNRYNSPRVFQIREKVFYNFIKKTTLLDDTLTMDKIELEFYAVNNDITTNNNTRVNMNEGNLDTMLIRKELFELIFRLSLIK